jgi:hypothetical protein
VLSVILQSAQGRGSDAITRTVFLREPRLLPFLLIKFSP